MDKPAFAALPLEMHQNEGFRPAMPETAALRNPGNSPVVDRQLRGGRSARLWLGAWRRWRFAEETLLSAFGEDSPLAFGVLAANVDNPAVVQVEVSPTPVQSLAVVFSDDVNAAALIGDGTIVSVVSLVNLASGPVSVQATQFAYDPALRKLTLSLAQPLAVGAYELQIDGSKIQDPAGNLLLGGRDGLSFAIPSFAAPTAIQAAGADLKVDGYSVPSLADWNNDGVADLVVGEKTTAGTGKVRVYLNSGTNAEPVYGSFVFAQGADGDLSVPASGCLGVFPRVFDWNGDGKQDLVWGLADGTLQVTLNENTAAEPRFGAPRPCRWGRRMRSRRAMWETGRPLISWIGTTTAAWIWCWGAWTARSMCC